MSLNWRELNARLSSLREDELANLIEEERQGERRTTLMIRMHQRFTALRAMRERRELLTSTSPAP
jgi:hypothetical protein